LAVLAVVCMSWPVVGADANNGAETSVGDQIPRKQVSLEVRLAKTISVEFRKTAIEDVLRIIADQADVDILKSPKVTGDVTVTLTDVPLEEALNNILSVHGFVYVLSTNMIRVITNAEQIEKPETSKTATFEIVYTDVKAVVTALDKFKSEQGSVSHIEGTSHIIVTDTETKIRDITLFIEKIDVMTPQVLVEARIYDITCTDRFDIGVQWEMGRNTTYGAGGITGIGVNPTGIRTPFTTGAFEGGVAKSKKAVGALRWGWLSNHLDIDTLLTAQKEDVSAKLLANPRILVLDNTTATIKIVSEIPYQQLSQGGGSTQNFGTTEFKEVGVTLEVTPHVASRDEMIRMDLKPTFSVRTGDQPVGDATQLSGSFNVPIVDTREAETTLLIKNGQTVVLGGLRKKDVNKQVNKIPILGDVPLLGLLFTFKGEETVVSEIVVFITTWITEQPLMTEHMTDDEKTAYIETQFPPARVGRTAAEKKYGRDQ